MNILHATQVIIYEEGSWNLISKGNCGDVRNNNLQFLYIKSYPSEIYGEYSSCIAYIRLRGKFIKINFKGDLQWQVNRIHFIHEHENTHGSWRVRAYWLFYESKFLGWNGKSISIEIWGINLAKGETLFSFRRWQKKFVLKLKQRCRIIYE